MKRSRPLSLFLSVLILITFFTVSVSAESSENLIDSDLRTWQNYSSLNNNYDTLSVSYYESLDMYRLSSSGTESGIFSGVLLDDTRLISGNSYTLSFLVPSPEFMSDNGYSTTLDSILWHYSDTVIVVGLGFLQANGEFYYHDTAFIGFNEENIESYLGKTCSLTFTAESYTGTPVVAIWIYNMENQGYGRYYYFKDFTLIDNSQEEEDGFFARLFEWFQEKFDAIGENFSNLGNKLTELKNSFLDSLSNLGDTIGSFFDEQLEGVIDFLRGFGNLILYFNWEGEYTNPFEREDSPIDKVSEFFDNLIEYVDSIGTSIENILDSITGGLDLFDRFTSRFPWLKGIAVFCLALIVISRFIGL